MVAAAAGAMPAHRVDLGFLHLACALVCLKSLDQSKA
jgi:hypothetical protein